MTWLLGVLLLNGVVAVPVLRVLRRPNYCVRALMFSIAMLSGGVLALGAFLHYTQRTLEGSTLGIWLWVSLVCFVTGALLARLFRRMAAFEFGVGFLLSLEIAAIRALITLLILGITAIGRSLNYIYCGLWLFGR